MPSATIYTDLRKVIYVLAIETFLIRAVAPGLGVARDQVFRTLHFRHTTRALDSLHISAKPPLPYARLDDGLAFRRRDLRSARSHAAVLYPRQLPV
jgi:hypothetical protein